MPQTALSALDRAIVRFDTVLRRVVAPRTTKAQRASPAASLTPSELNTQAKWTSRRLMRVNHSGEVCAQALYDGQAWVAEDSMRKSTLRAAANEELDHLAWCATRLRELGARPSLLDPLWYAGSFATGVVAGALGDRVSMAFLAETERQVVTHLQNHLESLPEEDSASRAILAQMKVDEAKHAATAWRHGAFELPKFVQWLMRMQAKIMTTIAAEI